MNIGIDASFLHFPGVGRYTSCLLKGLNSLDTGDKFFVYTLPKHVEELKKLNLKNLMVRELPFNPVSLIAQIRWGKLLSHDEITIFHAVHYIHPLYLPEKIKLVITLHDAVYFRYPPEGLKGFFIKIYYNYFMRQSVRNADELITVSLFSQRELSSTLGVEISHINIVQNGMDPQLSHLWNLDCQDLFSNSCFHGKYFLYVGSNKPWKNLKMALSSYMDSNARNNDILLVIAGKTGTNELDIKKRVITPEMASSIRILGAVSEEQLRCLYQNAIAALVPSTYEGFGYPALEAMGCGCPVIASTSASLPEVIGDAGILIDPNNKSLWTMAINSMLQNPEKKRYFAEQGKLQSQKFSIQTMAQETYDIYRKTLNFKEVS